MSASSIGWSLVAWIGVMTGVADAAVIGLDGRGGKTNGDDIATAAKFSSLRGLLSGAGHTLVTVHGFTPVDLVSLDALMIRQGTAASEAWSATEIANIQAFVASGGGLFVTGEGGWSTDSTTASLNALVAPYGVTYTSFPNFGSGLLVSSLSGHAVTQSVASLGFDYLRAFASVSGPAVDLTPQDHVLAVVDAAGGGGNVVLYADLSGLTDVGAGADYDIGLPGNKQFVLNLPDFLAGSAFAYGSGCAGSGGFVPELSLSPPVLQAGGQGTVSVTQALGGGTIVFLFGLNQASLPMGGPCSLNVSPLLSLMFSVVAGGAGPGNGSTTLLAPVPLLPGAQFTMQAFVVDPGVPRGYANTNGYEVHIQ